MGWEERNGRHYYYRKTWVNGTCRSDYIGAGELAEALATLEALDRRKRAVERDAWQAEVDADRALDRQIAEVFAEVRALRNTVLLVSGYHTHRGQWRKRRNG